jgi:hypothetical protein
MWAAAAACTLEMAPSLAGPAVEGDQFTLRGAFVCSNPGRAPPADRSPKRPPPGRAAHPLGFGPCERAAPRETAVRREGHDREPRIQATLLLGPGRGRFASTGADQDPDLGRPSAPHPPTPRPAARPRTTNRPIHARSTVTRTGLYPSSTPRRIGTSTRAPHHYPRWGVPTGAPRVSTRRYRVVTAGATHVPGHVPDQDG